MLISGGVIFSLFQLPALVDGVVRHWEPHTTQAAGFGLLMLYAYAKGALYLLIGAFVLHLGVRAYWVGLVGLNSVFSAGVVLVALLSIPIMAVIGGVAYLAIALGRRRDQRCRTVAARCPGLARLEPMGLRMARPGRGAAVNDSLAQRALRCLADMHAVTIDGAAAAGLRFRFATHARSGVDGIVAYLPTSALPRGEHALTVMPPPRRPGSSNRRPLEAWSIPFWL